MSAIQNSSENKFQNAPLTNSKLRFGSEETAVWELENWSDRTSFEVLKKHANCVVRLRDGRSFRFFLKEQKINVDPEVQSGQTAHYTSEFECLSLFVKEDELITKPQLHQNSNFEEGFNLKVSIQHLNDELQPAEGPVTYHPSPNAKDWTSVHVSFEHGRKVSKERAVVNDFIRLSFILAPRPAYYNNDPIEIARAKKSYNYSPTVFERPENLRYGITVQLLSCDAPSSSITDSLENAEQGEDLPIFKDFQWMYGQEDNHSDLNLESKDGMLISAHKFVLAARSSKFRALIEEQTNRNEISGTIKIGDVDAKPLMAILHWMYTEKLEDNQSDLGVGGSILEELIIACVRYELEDIVKLCEKKLITVCNPVNMLHLFQLTQNYRMQDAAREISVFIKENIDGAISLMQI